MQPELSWLTDPTIYQVGRLEAHSDHVAYRTPEEMEAGITSLRQPLDGLWRFKFSDNHFSRPTYFWEPGYDLSDFTDIQVPGHIELQGHGQIQYINTLYPWDGHSEIRPPQIDWSSTTVGSYVRDFDLDPELKGERVCVSFQGVEQAFYVWLNGQFVGYSEDTFTPSEFDLTPYLKDKGNRLSVEVFQRSSASWLEDQDMFRFSGIFRSVYLYAKPRLHLHDLWLNTGLKEDNTTGTIKTRLKIEGEADGAKVGLKISDPDGNTVFDDILELNNFEGAWYAEDIELENVTPWDHDNPALYSALVTLETADGEVTEVIPYQIGFRRVELKDGVVQLNGERLLIHGVNRHEWSPSRGRSVTEEDMNRAMDTILRNNINAVRTSHYPNQSLWYQMCDENGIYMMDETNMETHGSWMKLGVVEPSWNVPGDNLSWKMAVLDRVKSMFERDKNHPSILFWSVGNESYAGANHMAMADYLRSQDSNRLIHYEGSFHNREWNDISDVESQMYAPPESIREYLQNDPDKPFILCEYMHDMGNSLGGMESYIELEKEFDKYQGGFIWDYMDQALWTTNPNGKPYLGYGGDFGERQSDYNFSGNGIVFADGTEKPAMQEVRYWYMDEGERRRHDLLNERAQAESKARLQALREEHGEMLERAEPLKVTHGDGALGVKGEDFEILFSYPEGGPVSMRHGDQEWLWRAPRPAYWRAPTENDIGNGFAHRSSIWQAADSYQLKSEQEIIDEGEKSVTIRYTYTSPAMPGLRTTVDYTVDALGEIKVKQHTDVPEGVAQLPLYGLRFSTPEPVESVDWIGLSGETYPDRKKGGVFGNHSEVPHIPDYLVPQESGGHTDTHVASLRVDKAKKMEIQMESEPFFFSAIPYTPQQLEQAYHKSELPEPVRTVVTICSAMRGVGGIDSWGADVEPKYHITEETPLDLEFRINFK